jgi:hypothetical protein
VAIICSSLFVLCCLCSVPIVILSLLTSTLKIRSTSVVEVVSAPTVVQTEIFTDIPTIEPTDTLEPTDTPEQINPPLSQTTTAIKNSEIIIETSKIIDATVQQVEKILGSSTETIPLYIGDAEEVPDGGETRTYQVGKYTIYINYDKQGIAKGLQIIDGLLDDGYSLVGQLA